MKGNEMTKNMYVVNGYEFELSNETFEILRNFVILGSKADEQFPAAGLKEDLEIKMIDLFFESIQIDLRDATKHLEEAFRHELIMALEKINFFDYMNEILEHK